MKLIRPGEAREPRARGLSAREMARQAAIEKQLSRYIKLSCGHMQTIETSEVYAFCALRTLGNVQLYCERCAVYSTIVPNRRSKMEYPQEPLF